MKNIINIIKNKNGYMLVEIIVASTIALVMAYFLIDITIKLTNKNNDYYIDSVLLTDKNIITKEIMDDINSKKLVSVIVDEDHTKATLTYDDGVTKDIIINKANKTIKYGDYTKKLSDEINLEEITLENDNNILVINLPIYTNYSKEDYGIKLTLPYSADIEIVYPEIVDLIINNMPVPAGSYQVDTSSCDQAIMTYDYVKKGFKVSNVTVSQNAKCNPIVTKTTRTKFSTYIKNLLGTNNSVISTIDPNNSDGSILEKITEHGEEDYRYRGTNPNNYVMFNNELWRIIGVFDDRTHSISRNHLVKIIRNDSIGSYVWDSAGDVGLSLFRSSDIYKILNSYYNHLYVTDEEYCMDNVSYGKVKGKCDFTGIGIQNEYQNMIETTVNWFLGGYNGSPEKGEIYNQERKTPSYFGAQTSTYDDGIIVPVGLMYASDYEYAASKECITIFYDYDLDNCVSKNWLSSNAPEWTITPNKDFKSSVYIIGVGGILYYNSSVLTSVNVRPTLYLKDNVYYISGTGTQKDPYVIGID